MPQAVRTDLALQGGLPDAGPHDPLMGGEQHVEGELPLVVEVGSDTLSVVTHRQGVATFARTVATAVDSSMSGEIEAELWNWDPELDLALLVVDVPDLPAVEWSTRDRSDTRLVFAEGIATLGLLLVIFLVVRAVRMAGGVFGRLFRRKVGLTPAQYRKRFGQLRRALQASG